MSRGSRSAAGGERGGGQGRDVFLSYNSRDGDVVAGIAERLRTARQYPWFDRWELTAGRSWQRELASGLAVSRSCAVFLGAHDLGSWERQELEVALDRAAKDPSFRVFLVLLPGVTDPFDPTTLPPFLSMRTWVDLRGGWDSDRTIQRLVDAVAGTPSGPPPTPHPGEPPYQGLHPFDEQDAERFFGRSADVQRLLEKLKSTRFIAVVGPSGVGKSSLVRAGLVPALRAGALPGSESWSMRLFVPGARPLTTLAANLLQLLDRASMQETVSRVATDATAFDAAVALACADRPSSERVVWVVDQAEEMFTLCHDERERQRFFDALVHAATVPGGRCVVVLALRADFYALLSRHPPLAQLLSRHQALVGPLSADGLRQAIEGPARLTGVDFEDGLVATIVGDVARQPGALPLLQEALLQLWRRRTGRTLTLAGYDEAGRVQGAVAQQAESVFAALDPTQQLLARRLFLRLTAPGDGTEDTRRRASLSELTSNGSGTLDVIQALADGRMLVTSADIATGKQWVEVSHETLIRSWPRLRGWVDEDRAGLRVHRRLTEATKEWMRLDRNEGALYRDPQLTEAVDWTACHPEDANDLEQAFLAESIKARERERWHGRRQLMLAAGMIVVLALGSWIALRLLGNAERASSRAVAAEAAKQLQVDPHRALELAIEAAHHAHTGEAEEALRDALSIPAERAAIRVGKTVKYAQFSPDGRHVLTINEFRGRPRLWNAYTGRLLASPRGVDAHGGGAFSPSGRLIACGGRHDTVWIWTPDGRIQAVMHGRPARGGDPDIYSAHVSNAPFSPDERLVAIGGAHGVSILDVRTGRRLRLLRAQAPTGVDDASFSPSGRYVVATDYNFNETVDGRDDTTWIWEVASGRRVAAIRGNTPIVSPDGTRLLTTAARERLWTFPTGHEVATLGTEQGVFTFSHDGRHVLDMARWDSAAYAAADGRRLAELPTDLRTVPDPHISPDGQLAVSGPTVASVATGQYLGSYVTRLIGAEELLVMSPDGKSMLTAIGPELRVSALPAWDGVVTPRDHPLPPNTSDGGLNTAALAVDRHGWTAVFREDANRIRVWSSPLSSPTHPRTATSQVGPRDAATIPGLWGIAVASGSEVAVTVGPGTTMRVWGTDRWEKLGTTEITPRRLVRGGWVPDRWGLPLALSSDGRTLAIAGSSATSAWDTKSGRRLGIHRTADPYDVGGVALSRDGTLVVSSNPPVVWNSRTGEVIARLTGSPDTFYQAAFSPDGRQVATAGPSAVRVWSTHTGARIASLQLTHPSSLAFSPDGDYLVTASREGIRVWDSHTGRPVAKTLDQIQNGAIAAFAPSGRSIIVIGDHTVQTLACNACQDFDSLLELAERRARRPSNEDYVP